MAGRPPFDQFDAESEDNESYLERLQEYFTAYDIKDDKDCAAKRRATLLTSIRSNCFRVLKDLAFPDVPNMKTFDHDLISWLLCYASILSRHVWRSQRDAVSILLCSSKGSPSPTSSAN